jgi:hypothetical protein
VWQSEGAGYTLNVHLVAAHFIPQSSYMIGSFLSNHHFLCDVRRLGNYRLLDGVTGNRTANHLRCSSCKVTCASTGLSVTKRRMRVVPSWSSLAGIQLLLGQFEYFLSGNCAGGGSRRGVAAGCGADAEGTRVPAAPHDFARQQTCEH